LRKPRHKLTLTEECALAADLILRDQLVTKELMRKYNACRSLIDRVSRETKQNAFSEVDASEQSSGTIGG
jgi:hypothetical protein